jgi:hypothetical protein
MKKIIALLLILSPVFCKAQNLQMHYDFGENRKFITTTLEMYRPDSLGSTFWFADFDFNLPGNPRSMSAAYWEIAREFYIPWLRKNPNFDMLTFHIEYNDGFAGYEIAKDTLAAVTYNSVFLAGFAHPVKIGNFILTTQWLCRMPRYMDVPDFQFTLVWFQPLFKGRVIFTGFSDLWSQDKLTDKDKKEMVFQTEPQLWYLITPKIALGGEIEISKNFPVGPNEWEFMPTLAARWEF